MNYWLLKSEPNVYSYDDLMKEGETVWNGVRNHQAAKNLKGMAEGDLAIFYHSNIGKEAVAVCRISKEAYTDPTDETARWVAVSVQPVRPLPRAVTLAEMKANPELAELQLVRQSRLSVVPVRADEWVKIMAMAGETAA